MFIECEISFRTSSPELDCVGKLLLLPVESGPNEDTMGWKIWVLTTWIEQLVQHPEYESLLSAHGRKLDGIDRIETDVLIVGAGTS